MLLVVWLPSAVAVAALFATPTRRWPVLLATLALFQFATMSLALGISAKTALALTFSNQVEALICTSLGIRVLGKRGKTPQSFTHVVGLFGSAVLGCAVSATIAFMFFESIGLTEMLRWFLASVLGVIAASPVFLCLRQWLGIGDQSVRFTQGEGKSGFPLAVAAMFGIGIIVLSMAHLALVPLLFVAVVFAVIRYGQLAAAFGVLAYTAAALLINLATGNPAAALGEDPSASGLVLQVQMLLMLATALPIAAMLLRHGDLAQKLRDQNEELHDNLTILNLAEQLAGLGRWHLDLQTGQQVWSPQMLALNGLPRELAPDPGDICGMLPDGGKRLMSELEAHRDDRRPYSFEYSVLPPNGDERTLRMHVTNEFDDAGVRVALFAVAMDVTEQVRREAALREARERAIGLAAEAQKLALTDTLTGLANRRATLDWLSRMVRASAQVGEPLAVLMFDVDFFKRINDCFGHQTGDEVLKHVAALARSQVRSEDMVGRVGGEEFVCILSGLEQAEARALAERLRHAIAEGSEREGLPRTTVSVGLALARPGDTPESLLARADMALYEAKEAGRNQVRRAA
ncbi:MAG TPA: diguanylate cyclase [Croceibacterium sp.]|nr:diguanylate cyclase [Croceibacterium sp.]